jgi:cytochrome c biogenesis factor
MNDSLLYIPLFIASVSAFLTIILLIAGRKRNKTSIIPSIITAVILCAGNVYAVIYPVFSYYVIAVAAASVMHLISAIVQLCAGKKDVEETAERLVEKANENGGRDNISVIVIDFTGEEVEHD